MHYSWIHESKPEIERNDESPPLTYQVPLEVENKPLLLFNISDFPPLTLNYFCPHAKRRGGHAYISRFSLKYKNTLIPRHFLTENQSEELNGSAGVNDGTVT